MVPRRWWCFFEALRINSQFSFSILFLFCSNMSLKSEGASSRLQQNPLHSLNQSSALLHDCCFLVTVYQSPVEAIRKLNNYGPTVCFILVPYIDNTLFFVVSFHLILVTYCCGRLPANENVKRVKMMILVIATPIRCPMTSSHFL